MIKALSAAEASYFLETEREIPVRLEISKLFGSPVECKGGKSKTVKFSVRKMEEVLTIIHEPLYYGPLFPVVRAFTLEGADGKRLSELRAACEAWFGASRTAITLEVTLPPEERVERLRQRGFRRMGSCFSTFCLVQGPLYMAEGFNPDFPTSHWWVYPISGLSFVIFAFGMNENRRFGRRAKELAQELGIVQES